MSQLPLRAKPVFPILAVLAATLLEQLVSAKRYFGGRMSDRPRALVLHVVLVVPLALQLFPVLPQLFI